MPPVTVRLASGEPTVPAAPEIDTEPPPAFSTKVCDPVIVDPNVMEPSAPPLVVTVTLAGQCHRPPKLEAPLL